MAAASNSRSGLAARRAAIAVWNSLHTWVGQLSENTLQQSTGGLPVVNPTKSSKDGFQQARQWVSDKIAP